jgi:hypothetical protein
MSASLWYYRLGDAECGPVAPDELRFLQKSGAITVATQIREEGSNHWRSLSESGLIRAVGKRSSKRSGKFSPAAQFQQATRPGPKTTTVSQVESASAAKSQVPVLPTLSSVWRDQRRMTIAGVILGSLMLMLLAWLFWPETPAAPGMASSGAGEGAADAGSDQSSNESSSEDAKSTTAADSTADSQATGQNETAAPSASDAATDGPNKAEATVASSGAGESASVENAGAGTETDDEKAGINSDATAVTDTALAVGDDDGSRFSIAAPGETTFFGIRGGGRRFTYVVDCSGSMQGEPLRRAKEELIQSISKLPSHVEFQIVFFDDLAYEFPGSVRGDGFLNASKDAKKRATDFINGISGGGGTNVKLGMQKSLSLKRKPDTVFLLTDGSFEFDTPASIKSQNPGKKVRINTVAFVNKAGESLLRTIANENRGDFRFVP